MTIILAIVTGGLYAAGLYMMLRRNIVRLVIGLVLLSHAANLLVFLGGGLTRNRPPFVPLGADAPLAPIVDPLPQALVLTAIVISFAVLAFALVLVYRAYETVGSDDLDDMKATDT